MNVLESRSGRPLRFRPWVLLGGAALAVGAVVFFTVAWSGGSSSPPSQSGAQRSSSAPGGKDPGRTAPFAVSSTTPATGAQGVASNTRISVTFSAPVKLGRVTPSLSPAIAGTWVQAGSKTLAYELDSPLIPSSHEVLTVPGGARGVRSTQGNSLAESSTVSFDVAAGDTLRLQQLLAGLDYLPVGFTRSGPAPPRANLALDQPGNFGWRWPNLPSQLTTQWTQGSENQITKAAVMSFENQNGLGVDGIAGPAVWTALINDTINHKASGTPWVYVLVNKALPQNLTLWNNGVAQYVGIPVNTGAPGADTVDGTYAVFEHVRYSDMKGTNPDGTTYNDPNVPYASYFNGGDALHGFVRATYGSPQSNGCVEMSYANAAQVWPLTPIGTLVTVIGPDYGTAPPSTTTTTTAPPPPAPTTTAPPPPAPTTAPPPPPTPASAP